MSEDVIPPTDLDRLLSAFRKIIRAEFPQLTFTGLWEYSVQATDGKTIDCSPTDTAIPLPSLAKVPLLSGIMGELAPSVVGSRCVIVFLNGDPTKARCLSVDGATEHVMTTEATVLLLYNFMQQLATTPASAPPGVGPVGPWTGSGIAPVIVTALSAALAAQAIPAPPGVVAQQVLNSSLSSSMTTASLPSNGLGPLAVSIQTGTKTADVSGLFPGLGATK